MSSPLFTPKIHRNTTYGAIDPSRPELSAKGKTVIINGGEFGTIGSIAALSLAKAGAPKIALIGEKQEYLEKTKERLEAEYPELEVLVSLADASSPQSVGIAAHHIRVTLGAWDIFINSMEHAPRPTSLTGADEDDWWHTFEVNTRFVQIFARHFLSKCRPNATYIGINTEVATKQDQLERGSSAYAASMLAAAKIEEYLGSENSSLRVFTANPGNLNRETIKTYLDKQPEHRESPGDKTSDDPSLVADSCVWLASPLSECFRSQKVSVNWDVEELSNSGK